MKVVRLSALRTGRLYPAGNIPGKFNIHGSVHRSMTQFPLRKGYGRSPYTYVNQRLQIKLELLMMSDIPLETFWAF